MTAKYGLPYFQNFVNSELKPNMIRSMCCRLQLDLRELLKRGNGLFGSAEQTGSLGVVTLNCARLGYLHRGDEAGLFARLDELLELGRNSLEIKRKVIQRHMDNGLFPYTKRYLGTLRNHFSTLGVNGINEMIRNFTATASTTSRTPWGHRLRRAGCSTMCARASSRFRRRPATCTTSKRRPPKGTTYRFAKEDRKRFPGILQAGTADKPYYTNSSQLPVGFTDDPFEALQRQEELQRKYTGGTVLHLYMSERLSSRAGVQDAGAPRARALRICPTSPSRRRSRSARKHGYLAGEHAFCPKCDDERARSASGARSRGVSTGTRSARTARRHDERYDPHPSTRRPIRSPTTSASPAKSGRA